MTQISPHSSIRLRPISHIQPNLVSIDVFLDGPRKEGRLHIWARAKSAEKLRQDTGSLGKEEGTTDEQASTIILVEAGAG